MGQNKHPHCRLNEEGKLCKIIHFQSTIYLSIILLHLKQFIDWKELFLQVLLHEEPDLRIPSFDEVLKVVKDKCLRSCQMLELNFAQALHKVVQEDPIQIWVSHQFLALRYLKEKTRKHCQYTRMTRYLILVTLTARRVQEVETFYVKATASHRKFQVGYLIPQLLRMDDQVVVRTKELSYTCR